MKDLSDSEFVDRLVSAGWKRWEAEKQLQDISEERESGIVDRMISHSKSVCKTCNGDPSEHDAACEGPAKLKVRRTSYLEMCRGINVGTAFGCILDLETGCAKIWPISGGGKSMVVSFTIPRTLDSI